MPLPSFAPSHLPPSPPSQAQRGTSTCYHGSSAFSSYLASFGLERRRIRVISGLLATVLILVSGTRTTSDHRDRSLRCDLFMIPINAISLGCRSCPYVHVVIVTVMNPLMDSRPVRINATSRSNLAFGVAVQKSIWSCLPSDRRPDLCPSLHTSQSSSQGRLGARVRELRGVSRGVVDPHV